MLIVLFSSLCFGAMTKTKITVFVNIKLNVHVIQVLFTFLCLGGRGGSGGLLSGGLAGNGIGLLPSLDALRGNRGGG